MERKPQGRSVGGNHYVVIVCDEFTHFSRVYYFPENKSDASRKFEQFLSDVKSRGEVEAAHSDNGSEFAGQSVVRECLQPPLL